MLTPDDAQYRYWSTAFAGASYYYGHDPGPVARRAVRYHRPSCPRGGTAADVGCGEGQDLAFLAESGYDALGLDFTEHGIAKAQRLLAARGLQGQTEVVDLRTYEFARQFDLVLAANSLQFLGADASACLDRVVQAVAPGGVLGLSLFAREDKQPALHNGVFFISLCELLARFSHKGPSRSWQMLETAQLWQWSAHSNQPQAFVTLIARRL
ncbi:MAG TPA: class I SAM-dependent methyltransferase [Abditibacteriaceae bacterium]|nr:class I SAM-dependent methyltransferase [Abditibacteriaceae bacterium]